MSVKCTCGQGDNADLHRAECAQSKAMIEWLNSWAEQDAAEDYAASYERELAQERGEI